MLRQIASRPGGFIGLTIVTLILFCAALAPHIATQDPNALDIMHRFAPPSADHLFGTDQLGRDLFSRQVHGTRVAMGVALSAILIGLSLGIVLGVAGAYTTPAIERTITILFDAVSSFPSIILALALVAVVGPSLPMVVLVVALTLVPQFGRVTLAQTLSVINAPFIEAEQIIGASKPRIVFFHVIPNVLAPVVVLAAMEIPVVIALEASLSFLGLGIQPPLASWGSLLQDGYQNLSKGYAPAIIACLVLAIATLGFTLCGEALRDAIDPRSRRA
ncbi:ABC transporter permease [Mesorhizobium sp. 1M-11]|uniref:ABC transporter permease n=1 Tax=Mesorhizobium sp. 1M-11 TaxID=1529006 RepID=UPI0006C7390C|nr:ABC transporter permease [Mesorhizobium sp. 1M-11]